MKQINYKEVAQNYSLRFYYLKKSYQLIILILVSITIGSCYSIESDCGGGLTENGDGYSILGQ
jgi:hypothetical protein